MDCIKLLKNTTIENLKLKKKVDKLQDFKDYAKKYKQERTKYITQLEESIASKKTTCPGKPSRLS